MVADRASLEQLTRRLADGGKLIEAGWTGLRLRALADDAPAIQLQEMRLAFFAGAHHLFASMMGMLQDGPMETVNDLRRMDLIQRELKLFEAELDLRIAKEARG